MIGAKPVETLSLEEVLKELGYSPCQFTSYFETWMREELVNDGYATNQSTSPTVINCYACKAGTADVGFSYKGSSPAEAVCRCYLAWLRSKS